jgi:nitroreductase
MEPENAMNLICHRRSVFPASYSGERVDDQIIEEMIESARWAPTHKLTQPWRFTVFCDEGLENLAAFQSEMYKEVNGSGYSESTFEKLRTKPLKCSHIIAIGMRRDPDERVPEVEEICATACAVQNMLLIAAANNIGAYWSTGGITYYDGTDELFDVEGDVRLMGFIYIGSVREGFWPEGRREAMDDKVSWVTS